MRTIFKIIGIISAMCAFTLMGAQNSDGSVNGGAFLILVISLLLSALCLKASDKRSETYPPSGK